MWDARCKPKPPQEGLRRLLPVTIVKRVSVLGRPGSDLLFQALRLSTIGAGEFNGRVRDGIGYWLPAKTTRPAKDRGQMSDVRDRTPSASVASWSMSISVIPHPTSVIRHLSSGY